MNSAPVRRAVYRPTGRFVATDLPVHALTLAGVGLIIAAGLAYLTGRNGYAVGWLWLPAVVILVSLVTWAVAGAKCRSRGVGFGLGLLGGLLTVGGLYHIDQCSRWGVGWERLDRLPGYVVFRMESDSWWAQDARFPLAWPLPARAGVEPWLDKPSGWNLHWATFLGELVALALVPAGFGWVRAGRPFSETLNDWYAEDRVLLTEESAAGLRRALDEGSVAAWAASGVEKTLPHLDHVAAAFWYCPRPSEGQSAEAEVYVSVKSGSPVLLTPEEAAALTELVPGLADLAARAEAKFESESGPETPTDPTAARLIRIPGPHVGRAKDPGVRWKGRTLMWGLVFVPVVAAAGFIGSVFLLHHLTIAFGLSDAVIIGYVVVAGVMVYLGIQRWFGAGIDTPFAALVKYYRRVVTQQAALRPDALFQPEDPRVVYAEVAPRRAWADMSGRQAECEAGLLLIDGESGRLLYEGDRHRYIIPASAVLRCDLEEVTKTGTTEGLYAVVLVFRVTNGTHELPLLPLDGIAGATKWEKAVILQKEVLALCGEVLPVEAKRPPGEG